MRDEFRKKKYTSRHKPVDQPWTLKVGPKKYRGVREGGVSENAAYYVFTHGSDNVIEAYSLEEWYKFQPVQRYKALTSEEAELEFTKRNKHINYFSIMLRNRLKGDEVADDDLDGMKSLGSSKKKGKSSQNQDLKISEMDEWLNSSDELSADSDGGGGGDDDNDGPKERKPKKSMFLIFF